MSNLIDRTEAISRAVELRMYGKPVSMVAVSELERLPSAQPETHEERTETNACDCISRQEAIDHIDAVFPVDPMKSEYAQGITCGAALAKTYIKQLPSAQPERKTGRWLKISPAGIYECSECGKNVMTADIDAYDFCHGCGVKMEVEHE